MSDLARDNGITPSYVTRILHLAFLDPTIVARIVEGRIPADINTQRLIRTNAIPISWQEQRHKLGFASRR